MFLEQLLDYVDTIGGVLAQDPVYNNALTLIPGHGKVDKNKALVGIYISKLQSYTFITTQVQTLTPRWLDACLTALALHCGMRISKMTKHL
jgi:hypothetical protein